MKPIVEISCKRQASTIFSGSPALTACLALCSRCAAGPKRYLKKSMRVGFSGIGGKPSVDACARPRARRLGKSKAVAGGQGRTVVDRSADPGGPAVDRPGEEAVRHGGSWSGPDQYGLRLGFDTH